MSQEKINVGLWKNAKYKNYGQSKPVEIGGGTFWVNLYKNDRKETENHPDLNLVLVPVEPRGDDGNTQDDLDDAIPF